jgi:hypothetical protein
MPPEIHIGYPALAASPTLRRYFDHGTAWRETRCWNFSYLARRDDPRRSRRWWWRAPAWHRDGRRAARGDSRRRRRRCRFGRRRARARFGSGHFSDNRRGARLGGWLLADRDPRRTDVARARVATRDCSSQSERRDRNAKRRADDRAEDHMRARHRTKANQRLRFRSRGASAKYPTRSRTVAAAAGSLALSCGSAIAGTCEKADEFVRTNHCGAGGS